MCCVMQDINLWYQKVFIGLRCVIGSTMDVVVVKRRDCVIGSYTVLRTILITGVLAVLLACAGTGAGVTTRIVDGSGVGVNINVADRCVGNHGRDNACQTTGNYNGDGATGHSEQCEGEAAVTVTSPAAETPARTYASTGTFESTPGSAAVFAIMGLILIFCCGRIDPAQAAKATGFNPEDKRGHKVFKPILCVPLCSLWLYYLSMSFMSIAVMCIQPPINSDFDSLDKARWGDV